MQGAGYSCTLHGSEVLPRPSDGLCPRRSSGVVTRANGSAAANRSHAATGSCLPRAGRSHPDAPCPPAGCPSPSHTAFAKGCKRSAVRLTAPPGLRKRPCGQTNQTTGGQVDPSGGNGAFADRSQQPKSGVRIEQAPSRPRGRARALRHHTGNTDVDAPITSGGGSTT